ncbi:MAG: aromatic amino acid transport family protein [Cyanobacteria bacterium J06597_16]
MSSSSLYRSVSLIAGTTIGAGILALPAATLPAGFWPSSVVMIAVWLYMAASGLLIAEATIETRRQLKTTTLGFLATIEYQLGKVGAIAAGIVYIFIHYAMLVAYTARGGDILAAALQDINNALGLEPAGALATLPSFTLPSFAEPFFAMPIFSVPIFSVPLWSGHLLFSLLLGSLLFWSSEQFIGNVNSVLLTIVIAAFVGLVALTLPQVNTGQLLHYQHWPSASIAIPVMLVAFVYHNVIPVVATQLKGDKTKIRQSILLGSLIPLVMFLVWNAVILGSFTSTSIQLTSSAVMDPTVIDPTVVNPTVVDPIERLRQGVDHPQLGLAISVFSEFAIATSFIGFAYGLLSVFSDLFTSLPSTMPTASDAAKATDAVSPKGARSLIYALIFLPPLALSLLSPTIFFDAIDLSGALGTSILFGIIPAVMVWKLRYQNPTTNGPTTNSTTPWVPGGKLSLAAIIVIAIAVIVQYVLIKSSLL